MKELVKAFDGHAVRAVVIRGEPWFVAADVCDALGIADTSQAVSRLDDDEKLMRTLDVSGQGRETWTVNESGLYALVVRSNKPEAKAFRKWITSEVLPSIRKTGAYSLSPEARKESAAARSALTAQWQEHGADKFYHYINLTRREYEALGLPRGTHKAEMTREQVAELRALEALEYLKLVKHPEISGYHPLAESLSETVRALPAILRAALAERAGAAI